MYMGVHVVLYIADDDAAFKLVGIVLREHAPEVRLLRARDGDEALALLRGDEPNREAPKPDVIILDLNLPKKNGLQVLSDLKANESLRDIPVVMFSNSSEANDRTVALGRGARDYITKPSSFDLFVEAVRTACSLKEPSAARPKLESSSASAGTGYSHKAAVDPSDRSGKEV
jgi:DNA-binding response OmpR family regulator